MTNLVVISFKNESQAIDGSHRLAELESFGDITVYEKVIVKKDATGQTSVLQSDTSDGLRTVSGMALGTMIGAFAGPVGMLVGMLTGTLTGAVLEEDYYDFSEDFKSKVMNRIQPGTVAILAEVYEDSPSFIDNAVAPFGATAFRSDVDYVYDDYVDDQIDEVDEEIAGERAKIKSASEAEKVKIREKIEKLKAKRHQRVSDLRTKKNTTIARIKTAREEEKRSRLKKRISKHQAKIAALEEKLRQLEPEHQH
jgi:uncharacterized membrane protein